MIYFLFIFVAYKNGMHNISEIPQNKKPREKLIKNYLDLDSVLWENIVKVSNKEKDNVPKPPAAKRKVNNPLFLTFKDSLTINFLLLPCSL